MNEKDFDVIKLKGALQIAEMEIERLRHKQIETEGKSLGNTSILSFQDKLEQSAKKQPLNIKVVNPLNSRNQAMGTNVVPRLNLKTVTDV